MLLTAVEEQENRERDKEAVEKSKKIPSKLKKNQSIMKDRWTLEEGNEVTSGINHLQECLELVVSNQPASRVLVPVSLSNSSD